MSKAWIVAAVVLCTVVSTGRFVPGRILIPLWVVISCNFWEVTASVWLSFDSLEESGPYVLRIGASSCSCNYWIINNRDADPKWAAIMFAA